MKAAVYYNNNDVRIEEVEKPSVGPGELLVKIMASGICGSDVMEWYRIKKAPLILGHEIAGVVEEVGAGAGKFKKGDRVTAAHHVPCNTCRHCLNGAFSVCDMLRSTNFYPGGFAEYVRLPAVNVDRGTFLLPDSVSFEEGSFSEPIGCVVRGLRATGMGPGKSVLVIGSGISGLMHVKLAKALGAGFIAAVDVNPKRLDYAKAFGADLTLEARQDVPGEIKKKFGRLCDIVSLCASAEAAITQGIESAERGGTVLMFAPAEPGKTYPLPIFKIWRDDITIKNTYAAPPGDTVEAIDLMAAGRIAVKDMITHRLPLSRAAEGFKLVSSGKDSLKVIIEPNG